MIPKSLPGKRCCGQRKESGIYAELGLTSGVLGLPLDTFILCPPHKLTPETLTALGITAVGVTLLDRYDPVAKATVTHILDWIGAESYPNVADWLEEARHMGVSRRLPSTLDYSRITERSRLLVIHPAAWIDNADDYFAAKLTQSGYWPCRKAIPSHDDPATPPNMCSQLWYQDVTGGVPVVPDERRGVDPREVKRDLPSVDYVAHCPPKGIATGAKTPAIFASLPLSRLVVIRAKDGSHAANEGIARRSRLPVELEDE